MASDSVLSVRFTDDELAELRLRAQRAGLGVSTYIRRHLVATQGAATTSFGQTSINTVADPATPAGMQTVGFAGTYIGPS